MHSIHKDVRRLAALDLNLLVPLDALIRTCSVTQAAQQTGLSQSAMSHTLRRLRDLLDDKLLVRAGAGMILTPRAQALRSPLRSALLTLARVLDEPEGFEATTAQRNFRICTPDLFDLLVLPTMLEQLSVQGPHVDLSILPHGQRTLSTELENGDIDLAIVAVTPWVDDPVRSTHLVRRTLFDDDFRCFVRAGHPAVSNERISFKDYVNHPHLLVSPTGEGPGLVDQLLADRGAQRRIALRVPGFAVAPRLIAQSDLLLTAPASLHTITGEFDLQSMPLPIEVSRHGIAMLWHERFSDEPAHRWLRAQLVQACAAMKPQDGLQ